MKFLEQMSGVWGLGGEGGAVKWMHQMHSFIVVKMCTSTTSHSCSLESLNILKKRICLNTILTSGHQFVLTCPSSEEEIKKKSGGLS